MPIVFVHGVNTRKSIDYEVRVQARDALFREVFLPAAELGPMEVLKSPYWGDDAAKFAFDLGSVPTGSEQDLALAPSQEPFEVELSTDASLASLAAAATVAVPPERTRSPDAVLVALARENFVAALDAVYIAGVHTPGEAGDMAAFAAQISEYALRNEKQPAWLADVRDDDEFVMRLEQEIDSAPSPAATPTALAVPGFAEDVWGRVREGVGRLRNQAGALIGKPVWLAARELLIPTVPLFLGDIFVYLAPRKDAELAPRKDAEPIRSTVTKDLREASARRPGKEPLIVVGHSLGGVIAYDILSDPDIGLDVDLFCTVGSQVGLFEEMKLFEESHPAITASSGRKVAKPAAIRNWINVFDYNDVLSYRLSPIFNDVVDYNYPTGDLLRAHGAYFGQPSFYRRLGVRARAVLTA